MPVVAAPGGDGARRNPQSRPGGRLPSAPLPEHVGSWAVRGGDVVSVDEPTGAQRQASAADAASKLVAELLQFRDSRVEPWAPGTAEPGPVGLGGSPVRGQRCEHLRDLVQRQAHPLGCPDEGDSAQGEPRVLPLVPDASIRPDQAAGLVETESRRGHAAPGGKGADRDAVGQQRHLRMFSKTVLDIKWT
jgi:hypothetical protein